MALTATATESTRKEVCCILGMTNCIVVETSPDKPNVFLACKEFTSVVEVFSPIAENLKSERVNMGRMIIFCKKIALCSQIYSFFRFVLGPEFTEPPNHPISEPQYRLIDMFTSGTHTSVKGEILKSFKNPNKPLRIVIATIAFGLGVDCAGVRKIVHVGPPNDIEDYVQQLGRAGRDGKPAIAEVLFGKNLMNNTSKTMKEYCQLKDNCRRNFLFSDFKCYTPSTDTVCTCCDVCKSFCMCKNCR